jgi:hypothetical protein
MAASAQTIGINFVETYFNMLFEHPENLHKYIIFKPLLLKADVLTDFLSLNAHPFFLLNYSLYGTTSQFSRYEEGGVEEISSGETLTEKIQSVQFHQCRTDIQQVHLHAIPVLTLSGSLPERSQRGHLDPSYWMAEQQQLANAKVLSVFLLGSSCLHVRNDN